MATKSRPDLQRVNEKKTNHGGNAVNESKINHGDMSLFKQGGQIMATKSSGNGITKAKMGSVKTAAPSKDGVAAKGKTKGKQVAMKGMKPLGMCGGGMTKGKK